MEIFAETDRLLLREIVKDDATDLFEMDSDPEVHRYLGNNPLKTLDQATEMISFIRDQYDSFGIGRWAVIEKKSNHFIGWAGLKFRQDRVNGFARFYDLGYRFRRTSWGNGYATEASLATLRYGFDRLNLPVIYAMAEVSNNASNKVLLKSGMQLINCFEFEHIAHNWYQAEKQNWKR
jgi:RimJ/RimL family protein N-acetyltransferase